MAPCPQQLSVCSESLFPFTFSQSHTTLITLFPCHNSIPAIFFVPTCLWDFGKNNIAPNPFTHIRGNPASKEILTHAEAIVSRASRRTLSFPPESFIAAGQAHSAGLGRSHSVLGRASLLPRSLAHQHTSWLLYTLPCANWVPTIPPQSPSQTAVRTSRLVRYFKSSPDPCLQADRDAAAEQETGTLRNHSNPPIHLTYHDKYCPALLYSSATNTPSL